MMKLHEVAKDVDVSAEELIEILQDIDIAVDDADAELTDEQIAQVCDELGYASIEAARAENAPAEAPEPEASLVEVPVVIEEARGSLLPPMKRLLQRKRIPKNPTSSS